MASDNSQLTVSVQESGSWGRTLSITVPRERVQKSRSTVISQLSRNARLPGFRKGHMPASLIEKQFGPRIDQEAIDTLIQESFREALRQEGLTPLSPPTLGTVKYEPGSDLTFEVNFEVQPTLSLARVGGFVVAPPTEAVGEDEVDAVLERLRTERADVQSFDDERPDYGDEVVVEITDLTAAEAAASAGGGESAGAAASAEGGEPVEGAEAAEGGESGADAEAGEPRTYRFALGEGQALPDIEQAILTLEPGEWGEFDVRFPDDFPDEEQRGKERRLRIKVVEGYRRNLPALDDEFAAAVGPFESVEALRARVRADLQAQARQKAEEQVRAALIDQIVEANPFDVPASMVERYTDFMLNDVPDEQGRRRARTPEQEAQVSQLREFLRPQAEAAVRRWMVVEHLADREGLRATAEDVDARVEAIAEQSGRSPSDVWVELEKSGQMEGLETQITEDKVFQYLRAQSNLA